MSFLVLVFYSMKSYNREKLRCYDELLTHTHKKEGKKKKKNLNPEPALLILMIVS